MNPALPARPAPIAPRALARRRLVAAGLPILVGNAAGLVPGGRALAQEFARASRPEEVGLSAARLARLTERLRQGVDKGEIPGAVVMVARRGRIAYQESVGWRDVEARVPMRPDAIFRIASMTKPFTSLAIMMLAEEGRLSIADPAAKYLPSFRDLKVGVVRRDGEGRAELLLEAPRRAMTIHDLLRHTAGLTYGLAGPNPIKQAYVDAKVGSTEDTNEQLVSKLARLPLIYHPGTTWEYSVATDVLGRIVEVVSGQSLERFMAERIIGPLRLPDTGFSVPQGKADRGAKPQREGPKNELPRVPPVSADLPFKSGGGGMVSTAADYARFCQFWLNGGELDGVRLVSRKTVELMTSDHLPPGTAMGADMGRFEALQPSPEMGQGFGLGFAVRTEAGRSPLHGSPGDYFWGGAYGTYFWIDPKEKLFAILMMQSPQARLPYRYLMREMVYQAVVD
ncbi:MAG: serine hydrolase domain-containing protein [Burkholderiales bacterium]|jgi:CubicO group peptidase (beta-lactamase class C family)